MVTLYRRDFFKFVKKVVDMKKKFGIIIPANTYAGIVQRLVLHIANVMIRVRFPLLAPNAVVVQRLVLHIANVVIRVRFPSIAPIVN